MQLPDEIDDDLLDILGMMMWHTGAIARIWRRAGEPVPPKGEVEQARVLHKLLALYAEHGSAWRTAAADWVEGLQAKAKEKAAEAPPS